MVSFRRLATTALAAFGVPAFAELTPAQIVDNIRTITIKSQAFQAPAQSISLINGPLIVIGLGPFPQIIAGFTDIITTVGVYNSAMQGTPPVPAGSDADAIFEAFREFVRVHQALLNILIGKAGLVQTVPLIGEPVASVLRQLESVVDTIALGIIDLVESRSADLSREPNSLAEALDQVINSYEGLQFRKRGERAVIFAA